MLILCDLLNRHEYKTIDSIDISGNTQKIIRKCERCGISYYFFNTTIRGYITLNNNAHD